MGICLDGDADRIVVIDEKGERIPGDILIGIIAKFLKDKGLLPSSEIVGTVMSNKGLEIFLEKIGLKLARTKVGDRYISEYFSLKGGVFGGEPSGHLIFKNYSTTGDGILSALKVIEAVKFYKKSLSELRKEVELFPHVLINVKVSKKKDFSKLGNITTAIEDIEKKMNGQGRVLLRYSGTENLARVMVEGPDERLVQSSCESLASLVERELA